MPSKLTETIFLSDKREKLLLLLQDGPVSIKTIRSSLNTTSSSILPQIKKLRDMGLVSKDDNGIYELTTVGRLIVENLTPFVSLLSVFNTDAPYWVDRDLKSIPENLVKRIGDLGNITLIEPDIDHMYDLQDELVENLRSSRQIMCLTSFFHPDHPDLYLSLALDNINLTLILTTSIFDRMQIDYNEQINILMRLENVELFVCEDTIRPPFINVTDNSVYFSFFNKSDKYDHRDVMSYDKSALDWGKELFIYYRNLSEVAKN